MQENHNTDDVQQPSSSAGLFTGNLSIEAALNQLRLRLLDLTGRNRLINFKHTAGKSLQFVHTNMDGVFRKLTGDANTKITITPLPEPDSNEWINQNGRFSRPEPKEHAIRVGIDPSFNLALKGRNALTSINSGLLLRTLFYAEDLGKHCRKLEREAKLAIEETGANMLYLVFGFLEFPEAPDSEKFYRAPLLCVPVAMTKTEAGTYSSFHLTFTGEELTDNFSLREKVKRDFGLNLPEYDVENELSIEAYFDEISDTIATLPAWRVRRMMTLTLLSFTNMLLVRDLDPEKWPITNECSLLLSHPLVRQVFEGSPRDGDAQYATEYKIDDHPKGDIPLIYDADSSQHSALIDVLEGHNRVIEGPPGTGKSQTITNLIAAALQSGKKVLFVAEKLAALEVVKSRLTHAGLEHFVLELHSNKTNRKRVLEDIANRINMRAPNSGDLPQLLDQLEEKRKELKTYCDLVNSKIGNLLDLTLYQVMWRAELNRMRCNTYALIVQPLDYLLAANTAGNRFTKLTDHLTYLSNQFEPIGTYGNSHPLWGFFPAEFIPEDDLPIQRVLTEYADKFAVFSRAMLDAAALLGKSELNMDSKSADTLLSVLAELAPANLDKMDFGVLPLLFNASDPNGVRSKAILLDIQDRQQRLADLEKDVALQLIVRTAENEETATLATQTLGELKTLGYLAYKHEQLEATSDALQQATEGAQAAIANLKTVATLCGLTFTETIEDVAKVELICKQLVAVPVQHFHLRHEALRSAKAADCLSSLFAQLEKIQSDHSALEAVLYLDLLPNEADLKESILTLREGNVWYRIFQKRWRKAINTHRRLERTKSKKHAHERLAELESLLRHRERQHNWQHDSALRAFTGPHFNGELSPLTYLIELATWIESTIASFESIEVPLHAFDPITIDRVRVNQLSAQIPIVSKAVYTLRHLNDTAHDVLKNAHPRILKVLESENWTCRITCINEVIAQLCTAKRLMIDNVRDEITAGAGLRTIISSYQLPKLTVELESHQDACALLGKRFQGRNTDLEPILAAHAYGFKIKKTGLPEKIENLLLASESDQNYKQLSSYITAINHGWHNVLEFSTAMSKYGCFEIEKWATTDGKSSSEYAHSLATRTRHAANNLGTLLPWAQYIAARETALTMGLNGFVDVLEAGAIPPALLKDAFSYRFYASIAQQVFQTSVALRKFSGIRHSSVRSEFAITDREIIKLRGKQVGYDCIKASQPPNGNHSMRVDEKTEMRLLEHLIPQQRPRVPVRKLLSRAGRAIQELKPCFMMGPQAVAQFLQPGQLHFDIVIMDEASQLKPEEAIGAIARGTQLVVVGDPKQLPPTSFFSRVSQSDGDDDGLGQMATNDAESILDVCISHFQPVRTLRWHYRSRHESLITFSNYQFYHGNLLVFPSPYPKSKSLGLRYHHVADGIYENQMNPVEARLVVEAVVEHILYRSDYSIGVVTLNVKQRDLISEMLQERLRSLPEAMIFNETWEAEGMGLFIKNLENVQGDERDCIIISTTFGKQPGADVVRQNFGPISRQGGWRRLNVLFTRARKSVVVFSSMRPEDIINDSKTPEGTRALRNYLEFARTGILSMERETELPPDSDFEIAVMDVLSRRGYEVTPQLGVAGFRIDIAVKHPNHPSGYLAAIECDGATYHSGVSVRDRDRIRQEILEGLGWKGRIWRIWSTDWFRNPFAETERLIGFLQELREQPIPEEYLSLEKEELNKPTEIEKSIHELNQDTESLAQDLVFSDDGGYLEVEIGDLVTYTPTENQVHEISVRITSHQTNPDMGLIAENTPLGSILMGATVGDTIALRVPGKPVQTFIIRHIKRAPPEETT